MDKIFEIDREVSETMATFRENLEEQSQKATATDIRIESLEDDAAGYMKKIMGLPEWTEGPLGSESKPTRRTLSDAVWQALRSVKPGLPRQIQDIDFDIEKREAKVVFFKKQQAEQFRFLAKTEKIIVLGREIAVRDIKAAGEEMIHRLCVWLLRLVDAAYGEKTQRRILTRQRELHVEVNWFYDVEDNKRKKKKIQAKAARPLAKWSKTKGLQAEIIFDTEYILAARAYFKTLNDEKPEKNKPTSEDLEFWLESHWDQIQSTAPEGTVKLKLRAKALKTEHIEARFEEERKKLKQSPPHVAESRGGRRRRPDRRTGR